MNLREALTVLDKLYEEDESVDTEVAIHIDGEHVGHATIGDYGDGEKFLTDFVIAPEKRGQGVGQKAPRYLIDNYGVNSLTVAVNNNAAMHIYNKFGFEIVQGPYFDENAGESVYYMKLAK